jgi:hypothetical protein
VNNIEIGKRCTSQELTDYISGRALLVCDIEGCEYDLLDPNKTPALRKCDILVELHDHFDFTPRSGADELARRFSSSHEISSIGVATCSGPALEALRAKLTAQELADSLDERRPPGQVWLWLEAADRLAA